MKWYIIYICEIKSKIEIGKYEKEKVFGGTHKCDIVFMKVLLLFLWGDSNGYTVWRNSNDN